MVHLLLLNWYSVFLQTWRRCMGSIVFHFNHLFVFIECTYRINEYNQNLPLLGERFCVMFLIMISGISSLSAVKVKHVYLYSFIKWFRVHLLVGSVNVGSLYYPVILKLPLLCIWIYYASRNDDANDDDDDVIVNCENISVFQLVVAPIFSIVINYITSCMSNMHVIQDSTCMLLTWSEPI